MEGTEFENVKLEVGENVTLRPSNFDMAHLQICMVTTTKSSIVPRLTFLLLEFSACGERSNVQISTFKSAHLSSSNEHLNEVIAAFVSKPRQTLQAL